MKTILTLLLLAGQLTFCAQDIYPTHWWTGMKDNKLQLLIHAGSDIAADKTIFRSSSPDIKVLKVHTFQNRHYLIVDLEISKKAKPQTVTFSFGGNNQAGWTSFRYAFKARSPENGITRVRGVTARDFVYLLMPDRFCNGDPSNDFYTDMRDTGHDRNNPFDRHGGDLKGVESKLDYLDELGVTAVWMTPVVENDMSRTLEGGTSRATYHGYAFTNQYKIDKRLGGNEAYHALIRSAHQKGLKIIQDAVYNHLGQDHFLLRDLPDSSWLNRWPAYTNTSYKDQPLVDPYASAIDKKTALDGWFTPFLADINQRNPFVAKFLEQYAVWATEEFGIDGWRVDTYFYSDPVFLNKVNEALYREFPSITVFGEAWVQSVTNSAYFCENNMTVPFKHNSQGVTDFPLYYATNDLMNQPFGWNEGASRFYQVLAQDILYKDPMRNCIFLDNHDLDRFFSVYGEDMKKYKMAVNILLTMRGIPQLYYGSEILMKNFKNPTDAEVRKDFPGGWPGDAVNKFTAEGRTSSENEAFDHVKALAGFRRTSTAIGSGKLMQYLPKDGFYTYFRYDERQTIMLMLHTGKNNYKPDWNYLAERTAGFTRLRDVVSGRIYETESFVIKPGESFVFELLK